MTLPAIDHRRIDRGAGPAKHAAVAHTMHRSAPKVSIAKLSHGPIVSATSFEVGGCEISAAVK